MSIWYSFNKEQHKRALTVVTLDCIRSRRSDSREDTTTNPGSKPYSCPQKHKNITVQSNMTCIFNVSHTFYIIHTKYINFQNTQILRCSQITIRSYRSHPLSNHPSKLVTKIGWIPINGEKGLNNLGFRE